MPDLIPTRRSSRRDYRNFPPEYFALLERYERTRAAIRLGPMTRAQANTLRRELYRWKMYLTNADPSDEFAASLTALWNELATQISQDTAGDSTAHYLTIGPSQSVAAIRTALEASNND